MPEDISAGLIPAAELIARSGTLWQLAHLLDQSNEARNIVASIGGRVDVYLGLAVQKPVFLLFWSRSRRRAVRFFCIPDLDHRFVLRHVKLQTHDELKSHTETVDNDQLRGRDSSPVPITCPLWDGLNTVAAQSDCPSLRTELVDVWTS